MRHGLMTKILLGGVALGCAVSASAAGLSKSAAAGKALVFDRKAGNCLACHHIDDGTLMGNVGPELKGMKARYPDRKLLYRRVYDETKFNPMTVMPPFGRNKILSKSDVEAIVDYLYTL